MEFSFDDWVRLAREDPNAFEDHRVEFLKQVVARASLETQQRLKGLQFRIDMERRKARTPIASCLKLNEMMMDYLYDEYLPNINLWLSGQEPIAAERSRNNDMNATVLSFPDVN